jgi:hypothetical protein
MAARLTAEQLKRQADERREKAIATFPFERVETNGDAALAMWGRLKLGGRGSPVVLGSDASVANLALPFFPGRPGMRTAQEILVAADGVRHPEDLITKRTLDEARAHAHLQQYLENPDARLPNVIVADARGLQRQLTPDETRAFMLRQRKAPPLGEWPAETDYVPGLSVVIDSPSGRTFEKVHVGIIPTDDWTTIPAHLRWGGWNDCPHPEYHVAALRSWRDRFGAELVGLGFDRMDLRVARPPPSRGEALDLAREHYVYCYDIVDQGLGTLSALAALLLGNAWWSFWWD